MYITDIVYLLDVLVVIVYICHTAIVGIIYYCTRIGVSVLRTGRGRAGGGGGRWNIELKFFFAKKCSWGLKTRKKKIIIFGGGGGEKMFLKRMQTKIYFSGGGGILGCLGRPTPPPGGRAGSENNTLLPMTMTCDRLKFWSGPAWRSKVIIRKPWRMPNYIVKYEIWNIYIQKLVRKHYI